MSWGNFQRRLLSKMKKGPTSYEEVAKIIVTEYDRAVKNAASGDKVTRNRLLKGNKESLERYIVSIFRSQSKSSVPLDIPNLLAKGFVIYWAGGQMSTEKTPVIPSPGALFNVSANKNTVVNPGTPITLQFPLGKSQTTEQWINNLIILLKSQLLNISGQVLVTAAYPQPLPPGWAPGPGITLWTGYDIIDDRTPQEQNPSAQDDSVESEQNDFKKFIEDNGPIESIDQVIRQKLTDVLPEIIPPSPPPPKRYTTGTSGGITTPSFPPVKLPIPSSTLSTIENNLSPLVYKNVGMFFVPPKDFVVNYQNAKIPINKLIGVEKGSRDRYIYNNTGGWMLLHPEAAEQYLKWKQEAVLVGIRWRVTSAYRDLQHQTELQGDSSLKKGTVAKAGTSPHGWGVALDFGDLYQVVNGSGDPGTNTRGRETSALYRWMCNTGAKYGWFNPFRLCDGAGLDEMWHWEYHFGTAKV